MNDSALTYFCHGVKKSNVEPTSPSVSNSTIKRIDSCPNTLFSNISYCHNIIKSMYTTYPFTFMITHALMLSGLYKLCTYIKCIHINAFVRHVL